MRLFLREVLATVLAASLVSLPCPAANTRTIGFVSRCQNATLDGSKLIEGTNIYAGELLKTDPKGAIDLQFGALRLLLKASSLLELGSDATGVSANLTQGEVSFLIRPETGQATVHSLGVLIRPLTADAAYSTLRVIAADTFTLNVLRGALRLQFDDKNYDLKPGSAYVVKIQEPSMDAGQHPAKSRKALVIFLAGTAMAGASVLFLEHQIHESPLKP